MIVLGISAYYHDSSAAIVKDGKVIAAAMQERFSRIKHDSSFPDKAIVFCLEYAGLQTSDIDVVAFYEKPFLKFERLLETQIKYAPKSFITFCKSMPIWLKEKLNFKSLLRKELKGVGFIKDINIRFIEHHLSHAASAYYTSTYEKSAILVVDAVGEWATSSMMYGEGNNITVLKEQHFPNSIGLVYSAFTYYLGFKVNSDEYKVMGLAPYGEPESDETKRFIEIIENDLIKEFDDGGIEVKTEFFKYHYGMRMIDDKLWMNLFGIPRRKHGEKLTQSHCNLAYSIQYVLEKICIAMSCELKRQTKCENLCMSGGIALNCVMNSAILKSNMFNSIYVPCSPGDSGGAIGAALTVYMLDSANNRCDNSSPFLGPEYDKQKIYDVLNNYRYYFDYIDDDAVLYSAVAEILSKGYIIGWFQGRMEFGPRALGNRSILADPRVKNMKHQINSKIKFREDYRPFAPIIMEDKIEEYFETNIISPYMMFVSNINKQRCMDNDKPIGCLDMKINACISDVPAITHIDRSSRLQTVSERQNPMVYRLLHAFYERTGCPMLLNTSFNVMGEPIVCSPFDAINTFENCGLDFLIIDKFIVRKK